MKLFEETGCLSDEGLHALIENRLDETARLEAAEHLAYCDRCIDRYTALLSTGEVPLETPRTGMIAAVMRGIWVRVMQNTLGRSAVAAAAAVLAITLWGSGAFRPAEWAPLPHSSIPQSQSVTVTETLRQKGESFLQNLPTLDFLKPNQGGK